MAIFRKTLFPAILIFTFLSCRSRESEVADGTKSPSSTEDIANEIGRLFQKIVDQRHPPGTKNVRRAVFLKPHACAKASFTVPNLSKDLKVGLFQTPKTHEAWIRMSSDVPPTKSDFNNNTIGFAVKVVGKRKVGDREENFTQDFLNQNHPYFFVDTAQEFLDFTQSSFDGKLDEFFAKHPTTEDGPGTEQILKDMDKVVTNALRIDFWSTTPYRFGESYAKYKVKYLECSKIPNEEQPSQDQVNYLRTRLERDLLKNKACFELQVQIRKDDPSTYLDKARTLWSETEFPPQKVATITVAAQDIKKNDAICENFSFRPNHALAEHAPVGSVNEARSIIYTKLSEIRRSRNGVTLEEPTPR